MAEYKGYLILGKALKVYPDSAHWFSQGDVFTNEPAGSTLVARVGGAIFDSKQSPKPTDWNFVENGSIKSEPLRKTDVDE